VGKRACLNYRRCGHFSRKLRWRAMLSPLFARNNIDEDAITSSAAFSGAGGVRARDDIIRVYESTSRYSRVARRSGKGRRDNEKYTGTSFPSRRRECVFFPPERIKTYACIHACVSVREIRVYLLLRTVYVYNAGDTF